MTAYAGLHPYYGDLHSHCGISYGHGSLASALLNARQQLDFCSVTGHALWPDMPKPEPAIQHIVDFHHKGFARLRKVWDEVQRITAAFHRDGEFVTFLSFEMHSCADGDRTILYNGARGKLLDAVDLADLQHQLRDLGTDVLAFPHHIGYKRGQRGINWATFDSAVEPLVEIISMHGCSEADEAPRPFLHSMGPSDYSSTLQYGLTQGHIAGVIGSTDHHSAHPGSYGHGRTGIWAQARTRAALWEALWARRTYALTGDRIALQFAVNDQPMGAIIPDAARRELSFHVIGGAPLDCVDIVKNGTLLRRFSPVYAVDRVARTPLHTKLLLEVGWGTRGVPVDWRVRFGLSAGRLMAVEPRFRGPELVAPREAVTAADRGHHVSYWTHAQGLAVAFETVTYGNPNTATPATQGICLEVEAPEDAEVWAEINGREIRFALRDLMAGARAGRLGKIDSPAYRFHRAPRWWELDWRDTFEDRAATDEDAVYYLRVRQANDQWAWSSPIWVRAS